MPLKLTLKPNEKVLVGTAVLCNGAAKSEIVVLNKVPVLRQKDIITEEQADTVAKKIYFAILGMYVDPSREKVFHDFYFLLIRQLILTPIDNRGVDLMVNMSEYIIEGEHYKALKTCKKLIAYEEEIMTNGE